MQTDVRKSITLAVPAEIDNGHSGGFWHELEAVIEKTPGAVILDCAEVTRPSSRHIYLIWRAYQECEESNTKIKLSNVNLQLIRVLVILDLYDLFMAPETTDISVKSFKDNTDFILKSVPDKWVTGVLPDNKDINRAMDQFKAYLTSFAVPEILCYDLMTIFYEIATNIKQHSGIGESNEFDFTATPYHDTIHLQFEYHGHEFDPATVIPKMKLNESARNGQVRGYGLRLVKELADAISYQRLDNDLNRLVIIREW
jgi:anti-sigma regulatory factor (Ser/Thr protein kinase)/anti-anti-sigma regulatory factor